MTCRAESLSLLKNFIHSIPLQSRVGEQVSNHRFSLSPSPNFGDGAGTRTRIQKFFGMFGDGDKLNNKIFGVLSLKNPHSNKQKFDIECFLEAQ